MEEEEILCNLGEFQVFTPNGAENGNVSKEDFNIALTAICGAINRKQEGAAVEPEIIEIVVEITSAQLLAGVSNFELIPIALGKTITVLNSVAKLDFNTSPYVFAGGGKDGNFSIHYDALFPTHNLGSYNSSTITSSEISFSKSSSDSYLTTQIGDRSLNLSVIGLPTLGDSSLFIQISYILTDSF